MAQMYTIHIHAIPLSDDDGGRGCTVTKEQFQTGVDKLTEIFKPADLRFAFNPAVDWKPRESTELNSLHNGGAEWWKTANAVAAEHKGRLVIFLRFGKPNDENKPAGNWFAYPPNTGQDIPSRQTLPTDNVDFVAVTNQTEKFKTAPPTLAHEVGHYLGLFHTHPSWGPIKDFDWIKETVEEEGAAGMNGDLLSDTPPDPGPDYYLEKVSEDRCGGPASFKIAGVSFKPDRSNLMSYYKCYPSKLSPQQIAVVRKTIGHDYREHLIAESKGTRFVGVFRAGTGKSALWAGVPWENFKAKMLELEDLGLRLVDIETYVSGGVRRFTGVFLEGDDDQLLTVGRDWEGFQAKKEEMEDKGLRLIDFESYVDGGTRRYAGVFREGNDGHALYVIDDWEKFKAKKKEFEGQGLRLIDFESYALGSGRRYAGVFREGNDGHALWVTDDWEGFKAKKQELEGQGLRLIGMDTYVQGSTRRYAGVFREGNDGHALWFNDDWYGFKLKKKEFEGQGLRLTSIEIFGPAVS